MQQRSYTKNYAKIYFWQLLSILLNLLSLFIVIPQLSSQPGIYGIYSICISAVIFLSYADLGFVNAGFKYASENYAKGKLQDEIAIIGLVSFILSAFVLLFMIVVGTLSLHPEWLIKNLDDESHVRVARQLLIILAAFAPNVILQRALMIIFGVRLQDFVYQRVLIFINICKVLSVFYFYRPGHSEIVQYFLFGQLITTIGLLIAFAISGRRFGITLLLFLKSIRFSRPLFNEVKALALSTFFITIFWILYYEPDVYAIARLSGAQAVAYYSIGITCLSFFRTILGTLFNPFSARFNHFIALKDEQGLKRLYETVMIVMLPIVVFPILSIVVLSKPLVFTWVGQAFGESVIVVKLLVLCNVLGFIAYPAGILLIARKEIKMMYNVAIIQPLIFWGGVLLTFQHLDYLSFACFKMVAFLISGVFYIWITLKFLDIGVLEYWRSVIRPAVLPILFLLAALYALSGYLPLEKDKFKLLIVIGTGGAMSAVAVLLYYFTSGTFRQYVKDLYSKLGIHSMLKAK